MKFNIITIFPDLVSHYCDETILARAQKKKIIKINAVNLRDFAEDKHNKVDDRPYGGGPGMVMKVEPIYRVLASLGALTMDYRRQTTGVAQLKSLLWSVVRSPKSKHTILLSPRGKQFDQRMAEELSKMKEITFVCGRYEGVDQRVVDYMVDEEISVGPYVLAGGELGALVIIEAVSRLIPGVLGNEESLDEETFRLRTTDYGLQKSKSRDSVPVVGSLSSVVREYPQYTKPVKFRGWEVPEVLLSGDHKKIKEWRKL